MALTPPSQAIYPRNRIQRVEVLYDGTLPNNLEFSIARLTLYSGREAIGIRHDRNTWNENNEENGYPVIRGVYPCWFILPDIDELAETLNALINEKKFT